MHTVQKIQWKRLAVEATAIIISILLAFAIDAWWQDRGDRETEQLLLKRLRSDFVEMRASLRFIEQEHIKASAACVALMSFPIGEPLPETPEVDAMIANVLLSSRTFNPGSGAVAAFLGNEGAKLVHNQPLADLLLAWPGLVDELQEEDVFMQKGVAERWLPFVATRVSLAPYMNTFDELMGDLPESVKNPEPRVQLIADTEFINHVLDRYKFQQIALRDIQPLLLAVDNILDLLETEIKTQ